MRSDRLFSQSRLPQPVLKILEDRLILLSNHLHPLLIAFGMLGIRHLTPSLFDLSGFSPLVSSLRQDKLAILEKIRISCVFFERVTKQMERITTKRNRQVNHYLHAASKTIIDFLVKQGVGTIIVGKNPFWKQEVGMGRRNNQNFVQIPHARFIDLLTYKAELVGIRVEIQEESYTSKASFLDLDPIPTYKPNDDTKYTFSGKRIGRRNRLYRTKDRSIICADVNGSYNIFRKSKPDAFAHVDAKGLAAYVVQPLRLAITV